MNSNILYGKMSVCHVMSEYDGMRCADVVAEALIDWEIDTIFGLPGDGINGFMEALRTRQDKIKFVLVRMKNQQHLWHLQIQNIQEK